MNIRAVKPNVDTNQRQFLEGPHYEQHNAVANGQAESIGDKIKGAG